MKPTIRERDVLMAVRRVCAVYGLEVHRNNVGAMRNQAGRIVHFGRASDPDLRGLIAIGLHRGRAVAIEVKRPGCRPTDRQVARLRDINAAGGIAFWVDDPGVCATVLDRVVNGGCWVEVHLDGSQEIIDGV